MKYVFYVAEQHSDEWYKKSTLLSAINFVWNHTALKKKKKKEETKYDFFETFPKLQWKTAFADSSERSPQLKGTP